MRERYFHKVIGIAKRAFHRERPVAIDLRFDRCERVRRDVRCEFTQISPGLIEQGFVRHQAIDEPDSIPLGGIETSRAPEQIECATGADDSRQQPRRAMLGYQPALREYSR